MLRRSLTAKVLVAVGVTVVAVIAVYTFSVIRTQTAWWQERMQAQGRTCVTMVDEYLRGVMLSDRHTEVVHFLSQLKKSHEIQDGRIVGVDGLIKFSTDETELNRTKLPLPADLFRDDRLLQETRAVNGQRLAIIMAPVRKEAGCLRCHQTPAPYLGAIVLEKSMAPVEASIATNRNLMILYGVVIFALVAAVLWVLIVLLVSRPVAALVGQMRRVQTGDLSARAIVRRQDEIGELETGFNTMVASLDAAKQALDESHTKEMEQAGKLASIGELASSIAHEIRNPLAGIGAAVEVLSDATGGDPRHREIVLEIRHQIHRLNATLRDLLDFARTREPRTEPCLVRDLIKPMLGLVRADAQKQHVQIVEETHPDLPPICADARQLQQALLNVLLNAVQAMPQGGTLTVAATVADKTLITGHPQTVRIVIRDTGAGITPETLPKIFSPFFTTKHRGTGLGLAITRSIVEKHHGTIAVESQPGHGTAFAFEFAACKPGVAGYTCVEEPPAHG